MTSHHPKFSAYSSSHMSEVQHSPIYLSDSWLRSYAIKILRRVARTSQVEAELTKGSGGLADFASGHEYFGIHKTEECWILRERAPSANRVCLIGEHNNWNETQQDEFKRVSRDVWELRLSLASLQHGQLFKLKVYWNEEASEKCGERLLSHGRRVVQDEATHIFSSQVWDPVPYKWRNANFRVPQESPRIYEAHVGMAQEEGRVGTYTEFTKNVLPRVAQAGYNTIQLMAVQEHPYYGSFGYQVSNFFAPSSRFGTPEELMELVDTAHGLGISVIMDLVHSHAVKNEVEGLSRFDGSLTLYFHNGAKGEHPAWNTRCFDYGKGETLHFLLSNCRYWLDAFHFDGFRFDGVTSMIYWNHGLEKSFTTYDDYFDGNVDVDALIYLTLANKLIHEVRQDAITVAEDMSGMPGLAAPIQSCGVGFDYRLAMGTPDYWIKIIKEQKDEDWNVSSIWWELTNRRADEKTIGYAESHDQALVGDKTLLFRLADKELYWSMQITDSNLIIDRALAVHKIIRLLTCSLAGHGYLNFMGNEFGHPEWIDFPREGNNWSYHYARRQWHLRDDKKLKYQFLAEFDEAMMALCKSHRILESAPAQKMYEHVHDQLLVYERANLVFVANLNPTLSFADREIPCFADGYRIVLDSDAKVFGGHGRVDACMRYGATQNKTFRIYSPSRTILVFERDDSPFQ